MNRTAIKNYAIWARVQLIEAARQRAYEYEITEGGKNDPNLTNVGGRLLTEVEREQRWQLIAMIRLKGFSQVMEEAAYTWFNRFIALRFMEVNGYLPSKVRVFTDETGAFKPEILKEAMSIELEGLDVYIHLSMGFCASSFLAVSAIQIFVRSGMMCLHRGAVLMSCLVNAVVTSSLLI